MPSNLKIDPQTAAIALSHPIPGQSMTHPYRGVPWQQPPQFTDLEESLEYLFDKLTQPFFLKNLMHLFEMNASVESIARTILFTGFTQGKWTPSLMMLMYKPTLLLIATLAHKAGYRDIPMMEPSNHAAYHKNQMDMQILGAMRKDQSEMNPSVADKVESQSCMPKKASGGGFMDRYVPMRGEF